MVEAIPKEVKDLWDKWNIRGLVILSLALQTILVLLSPNRKRTHWRFFRLLIWSAYLLANWAAEYAVGQISDDQGSKPEPKNSDLLAFWATFLLLHLGGPDTITALTIEDNELWLRNLFALVCQAIITFYVFLLSLPNDLLLPTSLMLVAGIIKYVERIKALRRASLEIFKDSMLGDPDPGPDYARLMEEYSVRKMLREPTQIVRIEGAEDGQRPKEIVRPTGRKLTDLEAVQYAYKYFNIFKGLVVDLMFSSQSEQLNNSKEFFLLSNSEEALMVLEVELSFIYGTFFTKVNILHTWIGISFRVMALASLVSSLVIFAMANKSNYDTFDVDLTYVLLLSGIALDLVAIFIFFVSDWTFARLKKLKEDDDGKSTWIAKLFNWILSFRQLKWTSYECPHGVGGRTCEVLDRKFIFRRWSEYIYSYNLIGYSMGLKPTTIHNTDGYIHRFFDACIHSLCIDRAISCSYQGISFCFRQIKHETNRARSWLNELIQSSKGNRKLYYALYPLKLFLRFWFGIPIIYYVLDFFGISDQLNRMIYTSADRITGGFWEFIFKEVKQRSKAADKAENASDIYSTRGELVLLQEILDEGIRTKLLRYVTQADYDQSILMWHIATEILYQTEKATEEKEYHREYSKILSDYMMYLLFVQPAMMSTVAGIDKTSFMEAIAKVKKLATVKSFMEHKDKEKVCREILDSVSQIKERKGRRHTRRNVVDDAAKLADALKKLNEEKKWKIVSKVWVGMLCYGAIYCDPKEHVAQLSKGGEFISFIWLLMAHFGLGDQFQTEEVNSRARLILVK